jgi:uncharacterized tellurite resistance protein B-like protein
MSAGRAAFDTRKDAALMPHLFIDGHDGLPKQASICLPEDAVKTSAAEAVLAVLFFAAASDGVSKPAESEALQALTRRWSMQSVLREKNVTALNYAAPKRLDEERALENACAAIPEMLRPVVFANSIEICLIDGDLKREEEQFLERLAEALELADEEATSLASASFARTGRGLPRLTTCTQLASAGAPSPPARAAEISKAGAGQSRSGVCP